MLWGPMDKDRSVSTNCLFLQDATFFKAGYFLFRAPFLKELSFGMYVADVGAMVAMWIPAQLLVTQSSNRNRWQHPN